MADTNRDVALNVQPIRFIEGDDRRLRPNPGMALCLSGGGYRAMLFHVGAVWRLNELGLLSRLERISSVSGGSITAGRLGVRWGKLSFQNGIAERYVEEVVSPIRRLASIT